MTTYCLYILSFCKLLQSLKTFEEKRDYKEMGVYNNFMNKTQFKNNFGKFFQYITQSNIINISTNRRDTLQVEVEKNNRHTIIEIQSHIQISEEGLLNFSFECSKTKEKKSLNTIYNTIQTINHIKLFEAQDAFCKEQALEFCYNDNSYFYILIYTDMVESSLEFFDEALSAKKFQEVAF